MWIIPGMSHTLATQMSTVMTSCNTPSLGFPSGCGNGGGVCNVTTGSCNCSGWGDLQGAASLGGVQDGYPMDLSRWGGKVLDCNGNAPLFRFLWGALLVASVAASLDSYVRRRVIAAQIVRWRAKQAKEGKGLRWWRHKPLVIVTVLMPIYFACFTTLCLLKVITPRYALVYVDVVPTMAWMCTAIIMTTLTAMTLPARVERALKKAYHFGGTNQQDARRSAQKWARRLTVVASVLAVLQANVCMPLFFPIHGHEPPSASSHRVAIFATMGGLSLTSCSLTSAFYFLTLRRFYQIMHKAATISQGVSRRRSGRAILPETSFMSAITDPQDVRTAMRRAKNMITLELATIGALYFVQGLFTLVFIVPSLWRNFSTATFGHASVMVITSFTWAKSFSMKGKTSPQREPAETKQPSSLHVSSFSDSQTENTTAALRDALG